MLPSVHFLLCPSLSFSVYLCVYVYAVAVLQLDAAHVCYLVAGVTPVPIDAGAAARMLLLGVNHTTTAGLKAMRQLLPLMRSEVYEWSRSLAGEAAERLGGREGGSEGQPG